jgi:peptidoglycan hydrolase-like protein with peptidoglycan-binding domain
MQRFIVASAFLSLVVPLSLNAQTIPPQNTTCTQTDPVTFAACAASTTLATTSTTTPATTTTPFPIDIPLTPNIVNVREALTTWLQKNTPVFLDAQSWLNIGTLSAPREDLANTSSLVTNLQKALDQNTFIVPGSYYAPQTGTTATPSTTTAPSPEAQAEITAKLLLVQEILGKIDAIKATMPTSSAPDTNVPPSPTVDMPPLNGFSFTRTLQLASEGDDVQSLQQFLAQDPTIYPEARITGYFGSLTRAAVGRWQLAHHIVSSESADGFGIVGPKTRAAIIAQIDSGSTSSNNPITPPTQDNTSTQINEPADPSSFNDPMTSLVTETNTLIALPTPTDTPPTSESGTVNTSYTENATMDIFPEGGVMDTIPPDWLGLKWF